LALEKAKDLRIKNILIACDSNNLPSRKVIEKNQGHLEKSTTEYCYYWIDLSRR